MLPRKGLKGMKKRERRERERKDSSLLPAKGVSSETAEMSRMHGRLRIGNRMTREEICSASM